MGSTVFNMPHDYYGERENSHGPSGTTANAGPSSTGAPGIQSYGWDGYYTTVRYNLEASRDAAPTPSPPRQMPLTLSPKNTGSAGLSEPPFPVMYPSPSSTTSDTASQSQQKSEESPTASEQPSAPKRKRENRYKNAPPAVLSRRRAQNRASQRAYRERKEQRIRDLEGLLDEAHRKHDSLTQAYLTLQGEYEKMRVDQNRRDGTPSVTSRPGPTSSPLPHSHHSAPPPLSHAAHHNAASHHGSQPHAASGHSSASGGSSSLGMDFGQGSYGFNIPVSSAPTSAVPAAGDMMGGLYVSHHPPSHDHLPGYSAASNRQSLAQNYLSGSSFTSGHSSALPIKGLIVDA